MTDDMEAMMVRQHVLLMTAVKATRQFLADRDAGRLDTLAAVERHRKRIMGLLDEALASEEKIHLMLLERHGLLTASTNLR